MLVKKTQKIGSRVLNYIQGITHCVCISYYDIALIVKTSIKTIYVINGTKFASR